jgi:hypothetical protein
MAGINKNMEINKILEELYILEPSLKEYEPQLINLISQMSELKPDTKFDKDFAARLKKEILQNNKQAFKINFNFMNKRTYLLVGSLAAVSVIVLFVVTEWKVWNINKAGIYKINFTQKIATRDNTPVFKLESGAYGSLASLNSGGTSGAESAKAIAPQGLGGGGGDMATAVASPTSFNASSAVSSKMIAWPMYNFKYVYKGDALDLKDTSGSVFRRLKGDGYLAGNLVSLINNHDLGVLNLGSLDNLKMTNLSLVEDKNLGLMVNVDFNDDSVYMYENWEKWRIPERDACTDDACFSRFRLSLSDVPNDSELVTMANNFLDKYNISREHYGQPLVDNLWRENYEKNPDKSNLYIPEYVVVVYPLMLNDEPVYDQSGNYAGLRVTINLLKKAASGLNGLTPYRYEASDYALETDATRLNKVIENGGWNRIYYYNQGEGTKTTEIELGTPTKSLVQMWRYTNNRSEELFVPALVFPVLNAPTEYYGQKFITIPLVKELVDELLVEPNQGGGGIMPLSTGVSSPASGPMMR